MKISLAIILDTLFYLVAGFFLFFVLINYYLPRPASYVLSATLAVIFTLITVKLSLNRKQKKFSSAEKEKKYRVAMTKLNLSDERSVAALFEKAMLAEGYLIEKKRGGIYIPESKKTLFFRFGFDGVSKTDIVKCFNSINKAEKAEIFSEKFSDEIKAFAARFGGKIILTDGKATYLLLEKHALLPVGDPMLFGEEKKPSLDFSRLFDKKRAKNYLVFGLLFVFLSYIAPIKGYYVAFGAAFLIFALILKFFGKTSA
ncbi:MAG: hypothetical protein J5911_05350 [Clostridia bacterium]|nr:hypothetical protein [Clostridia bacterium]